MVRKPNEKKVSITYSRNNIGKRFSNELKMITDASYYEGSVYGQYFNIIDLNGKSNTYVYDACEELIDEFDKSQFDDMKFLVGLSGIGKTTLIRNYYGVVNRSIGINNNSYVIYMSFNQAYLSLSRPYDSINNEIRKHLSIFVQSILSKNSELFNQPDFWNRFYDYITNNNAMLFADSVYDFTPWNKNLDIIKEGTKSDSLKLNVLDALSKKCPLDYYISLIKYIMTLLGCSYKLTFILDDIEDKEAILTNQIIEAAYYLYRCFRGRFNENSTIKVLVALRSFTFRGCVRRMSEAGREILSDSVLLKTSTVSLHDIFKKRFAAVSEMRRNNNGVVNIVSYEEAKKVLDSVEEKLNEVGNTLILSLQNYNYFNSMDLYCKAMTSVELVPFGEVQNSGAFRLCDSDYRITTSNLINAIGKANASFYDGKSTSIPNILQHNGIGSELYCLYVIRYLMNRGYIDTYGSDFIEGNELLKELVGFFCNSNTSVPIKQSWTDQFDGAITFLYHKGVLLRSLYDIEGESRFLNEKENCDSYKLYLSPRGCALYRLLSNNSALMDLFRDDFEADLRNNDVLTSEMQVFQRFEYSINLLVLLFDIEKRNIAQALWDIHKYTDIIGHSFICEHILAGVINSIISYYRNNNGEREKIKELVNPLINEMRDYAVVINKRYGECFNTDGLDKLERMLK